MKFLIDNWSLLSLAIVSGLMLVWPVMRGAAGGALSSSGAVQLINREKAVVIDVSEPQEFAVSHVGGARNIPVGELDKRLPETVKNKAVPVIMVCATGARAKRAAGLARKLGYEKVEVLAGGLKAWKEANLPVEKS